jgi:hypothetical protein
MPQIVRHYCTNCKESVFNKTINGVRVPFVIVLYVGQPEDTGPQVDLAAVDLPSVVRELMQMPIPRLELCVPCFVTLFGLQVHSFEDDPMSSVEQYNVTAAKVQEIQSNREIQHTDKANMLAERALTAIKVGRGVAQAPPLPPVRQQPQPPVGPGISPAQ